MQDVHIVTCLTVILVAKTGQIAHRSRPACKKRSISHNLGRIIAHISLEKQDAAKKRYHDQKRYAELRKKAFPEVIHPPHNQDCSKTIISESIL